MDSSKRSVEQIIAVIPGSAGIKARIARRLGVHRFTIDNYLARYATVREAYEEEVESVGDDAEGAIVDAIRGDDLDRALDTAKWYARMKLKDRGYVERNEHSGVGGAPLEIAVKAVDYRLGLAALAPPDLEDATDGG